MGISIVNRRLALALVLASTWVVASAAPDHAATGAGTARPADSAGRAPTAAAIATSFGRVPLFFERNTGQADARYQFHSRAAGHSIYLGPTETVIAIGDSPRLSAGVKPGPSPASTAAPHWLRLALIGANPASAGHGLERFPGQVNHVSGPRAGWTADTPAFARVRFDEVYAGIDLVFYGNQREFEYDFEIAPNARPEAIAFRIDGADGMEIDARGDLVLRTGSGTFRQRRPVAYQIIDGRRRAVDARFVLDGVRVVTFALGPYDRSIPLVIDPVLSLDYSTYLGSGKIDRAWAIATDVAGNVYVAGETFGPIKTVPAIGFQTNFGGGNKYGGDAFVAKLDATGTNMLYFTYLGGESLEVANGLAVDVAGAAYVTGFTLSPDFPTFNAAQPAIAGTNNTDYGYYADAFVTKLDATGFPVYSTFLGGEVTDVGAAIAVDADGAAYVTGYTESALVYRVPFQVTTTTCTNYAMTNLQCGPVTESIVVTNARVPFALTTIVTNSERSVTVKGPPKTTNIIVNASVWVAGDPDSWSILTYGFPIRNPVQWTNAGAADLFISKISPDGTALVYSTYLGGGLSRDYATGIGVDAAGNVVVSGLADEADFPVTNALQPVFSGGRDALALRLDATGSAVVYATYLGGSQNDAAYGLAAGPDGSAYVVGATASTDFLGTPGLLRPGGLSRSTNSGGIWTLSSTGLTHTGVRALAVNPVSPSTLYAGTPRGVYLTINRGDVWTLSSEAVSGLDITAVALDPVAPSTVYAAGPDGFARSDDSGFSWVLLGGGLPVTPVSSIVVDPVRPETLHVGAKAGYYVSTNLGTNFFKTGDGIKSQQVNELILDPTNPDRWYAGTGGGVFQSTNHGANWKSMNTGLSTKQVLALAINPSAPQVLLAGTAKGVFRTLDAGVNWEIQTNGLGKPHVNDLVFDPTDSSIVYAACTNGVFRSADGGINWTGASAGLLSLDLVALAVDPTDAAIVYAGARGTNFSGGTNDAFIVKLSSDGASLDYGFTFGGSKSDEARAVAIDTNGSAFVAGMTLSKNFPVVGPVPASKPYGTNSGKTDGFIAQFDAAGRSNVFSIHFGGKATDTPTAIALDRQGGLYLTGMTDSGNFVTTNAFQPKRAGDKLDVFISKFVLSGPPAAADAGPGARGIRSAGWPARPANQATGSVPPFHFAPLVPSPSEPVSPATAPSP